MGPAYVSGQTRAPIDGWQAGRSVVCLIIVIIIVIFCFIFSPWVTLAVKSVVPSPSSLQSGRRKEPSARKPHFLEAARCGQRMGGGQNKAIARFPAWLAGGLKAR